MTHTIYTLSNGLRVMIIDTASFPTVTTLLLVGAGSRYENTQNNGIAHFLEHMFFKGSKKYPNPEIISQEIEGMGGYWNAFTSKDYTGYYIKGALSHFPKMIDIISDLLLRSLFDAHEIEKEKGVIVEEINMYEDMPQRRIGEIFENIMFPGNPLGFDIAGTKKTVTSFERNTFVDYMQSLYQPQNAVLIVAGGLTHGKSSKSSRVNLKDRDIHSRDFGDFPFTTYLDIIKEKFGGWKKDHTIGFSKYIRSEISPIVHVSHKKTEQAHFCLGFPTLPITDARRPILKVLATVLGGGASSRLFQEVREKRGLCYYISTGVEQYADTGYIVTQSGVAKDPKKVKDALSATIEEHLKITHGTINGDDIARSKEMIKGRLLLSMEDSFNVANFYGMRQLREKKIETPEELLRKIDLVTREEIITLAQELFASKKLHFAIIGPFKKDEFKENILQISGI